MEMKKAWPLLVGLVVVAGAMRRAHFKRHLAKGADRHGFCGHRHGRRDQPGVPPAETV
jgi:hypothetical protein